MHSIKTLVTLFLLAAPAVLGACNEPRETGENPNCWGGSFTDCVARRNLLCTGECAGQPAGGAGAPCHTSCQLVAEQQCAGWCAGVYDCDSCKKALELEGSAEDDEGLEEACSKEGDMYYCNCD